MKQITIVPNKNAILITKKLLEGKLDETADNDLIETVLGMSGGNKYAMLFRCAMAVHRGKGVQVKTSGKRKKYRARVPVTCMMCGKETKCLKNHLYYAHQVPKV